jgi:GTP diphosphokinase / guanosine-3',5'-bis(diphosphate) 3'-diphosphatase
VAALVNRVTRGEDADLVVAALIHDAVEDQGISGQTITAMFGENVAGLVLEVTDNKSLPQEVRKRLQVDQAPKKSQRAKILKLADKISNVTAIGRDPPPDWPIERQLSYVQWGRDVVAGLRGASPELGRMFDEGADEATRQIASRRR